MTVLTLKPIARCTGADALGTEISYDLGKTWRPSRRGSTEVAGWWMGDGAILWNDAPIPCEAPDSTSHT